MAQSEIYGEVNIGGILAAFVRLGNKDYTKAFQRIRKPAHYDQRDHRDRQRGPQGPWPALAPTTLARYAREGKRRNRRILARLPNARRTTVTSRALTLRSPVRWSMAHQDGPTRVGRGSILPQRQFFWISKVLMATAKNEFQLQLLRKWLGIP